VRCSTQNRAPQRIMANRPIKLSELERTILVTAHLRAGDSAREIARRLKLQERTVRDHLHRMEQRGIIRRLFFINVYPLGLRYFNIYFSFSSTNHTNRQRIVRELQQSAKVSWIGELGGDFNLGFALLVRTPEECLIFLEELSSKVGEIFLQKEIVSHRSLTLFSARYLAPHVPSTDALGYAAAAESEPPVELDSLDSALLRLLSAKGSLSIRAIAQSLGTPHSTIALRMKRLSTLRILSGEWYGVDVKRLGYQTLKLLVEVRSSSQKLKRDLYRYVEQCPQFVYLIECLGKWDFEIGCDVATDASIASIIDEFTDTFGNAIVAVKIVPMFKVLKSSLFP
jgi:DNA-binding Lrp family transcriptional regulator